MRVTAPICLGVLLAACSTPAKDGTPIVREGLFPGDGSLIGTISEVANPGSTYKSREAADNARCRELGFKAGSDAFANCRLQLEAARRRAMQSRSASAADDQSTTAYSARECVGPVIMSERQRS